ncbi:MAG: glycogen/starch synthase [Muribaculaceae bacterium]|nr:glycogen/starch synthase [Muribaculaceae bacterium]
MSVMPDFLIETSWEVCNKVGGIYAVLSTKAKALHDLYGDRLLFVGPDLWTADTTPSCFKESPRTLAAWRKQAAGHGISARVGRWQVPGKPLAILVQFRHLQGNINDVYAEMWQRFGVDSLHAYGDYDEACAFAVAAGRLIENLISFFDARRVIAHFDEWTTGMGLLHVKSHCQEATTVFTTHATSIGRSIAGNGKPLYDYMSGYHGDQMAGELNMQSKHSLEKAAAQQASVFTTVSEVTARECEQLLERRPLVTPNGFEPGFVPKGKKLETTRLEARRRLLEVASCLTGTAIAQDAFLIATAGRCEFRNKGIDAYLDGLNVLRTLLSEQNTQRQVVAFVLVPCWVSQPRADLEKALQLHESEHLDEPIVTHQLHNHDTDAILNKMRTLGFNNEPDAHLLVIDIPCYLNGDDGIVNLNYYDVLAGLDLTVFPSYYEPWGYTPLESVAFGVPTITTNLSGFGQWVLERFGHQRAESGVSVVERTDSNYSEVVHNIAHEMLEHIVMTDGAKHTLRLAAKHTAQHAVWSKFITYYIDAYNQLT